MAVVSSTTIPGKRGSEFPERSVRQKLDSKELTYLERLPYEIKRMVAEHFQSRDDLKNLAEVSAHWKDAVLEVINLQNMHTAVEELKDLANLDSDEPEIVSSALDVYKDFMKYYDDDDDDNDDFVDLIDNTKLPLLLQNLTAMSTQQVAERFKALKHESFDDIGLQKASLDSIEQKYSDLKCEFVMQAFELIIASALDPEGMRGRAVECAADHGHLEVVQFLLSNGAQISDEARSDAVDMAAYGGHLEVVRFLVSNGAQISEEDRGRAVKDAAEEGHLEVVQFLLSNGAQISVQDRGQAVAKSAFYGHLEVVQFLLSNGAQISEDYKSYADTMASHGGNKDVIEFLRQYQG